MRLSECPSGVRAWEEEVEEGSRCRGWLDILAGVPDSRDTILLSLEKIVEIEKEE